MNAKVSPVELKELLEGKAPFVLLDVREQKEYEKRQIFGAMRIGYHIITHKLSTLVSDKSLLIILYSNNNNRALGAAEKLKEAGYQNVKILSGGLNAWEEQGFYTVEGVHVQSKAFGEIVGDVWKELTQIDAETLQKWLTGPDKDDIAILDVRPYKEVKKTGSLPGAVCIPGVELYFKISDYINAGKKVVLTCAGRTRSIIAAATVRRLGIGQVYELKNGTRGWILAGGKLQSNIPEAPEASQTSIAIANKSVQQIAEEENISFIDSETLYNWQKETNRPLIVLDVRQKNAYLSDGHIPYTRQYEGGQVIQNTDDVLPIHNADYVLVSREETRAIITAYWLKRMGIPNIHVLKGGILAWKQLRYPISDKEEVICEEPYSDRDSYSNKDSISEVIEEAKHYIGWEEKLAYQPAYMEFFRRVGVID